MNDQIFLKDYRKSIEIGAFQEERQILQDILVNITVDLSPIGDVDDSDVDGILSYDVLVDAVDGNLAARRYNLLETLAEDIASAILSHDRALEVQVEIQKLGRIDGVLGARITRKNGRSHSEVFEPSHQLIFVFKIDDLPAYAATAAEPAIFLPMVEFEPASDTTDQHIAILKLDQMAWEMARALALPVVDTKTETQSLMARGHSFVRAYGKQVFSANPPIETLSQTALIEWAKAEFNPISIIEIK